MVLIFFFQLSLAVKKATPNSLILIDEFGASTYENDGAYLLAACLDHWCTLSSGSNIESTTKYSNSQNDNPSYNITQDNTQSDSSIYSQNRIFAKIPHVFVSTHFLQLHSYLKNVSKTRFLVCLYK